MARKKKEDKIEEKIEETVEDVQLTDVSDVEEIPAEELESLDKTEVEAAIEAGEKLELVEEVLPEVKVAPKAKAVKTSDVDSKDDKTLNSSVAQGTFGLFFR